MKYCVSLASLPMSFAKYFEENDRKQLGTFVSNVMQLLFSESFPVTDGKEMK